MCRQLDEILGRPPPRQCNCTGFVCPHDPPVELDGTLKLEDLRRWRDAELHRIGCRTCFREQLRKAVDVCRRANRRARAYLGLRRPSRERPRRER